MVRDIIKVIRVGEQGSYNKKSEDGSGNYHYLLRFRKTLKPTPFTPCVAFGSGEDGDFFCIFSFTDHGT